MLTFPLPVLVPPPPALGRADLGLPEDAFVFLFVFDFFSTLERKNPLGLIDAFTRAFPEPGRALLYLKSINGSRAPSDLARVREAAAGRPDIVLSDGYLEGDRLTALTALCDCYVSLHRSEGFGLTIAEAMAFGKPAIATGYCGNLAFMDAESSYLVPYELVTLDEAVGPYPPAPIWADPDLDEAARLMRHVVEQPDEARERGRARQGRRRRAAVARAGGGVPRRPHPAVRPAAAGAAGPRDAGLPCCGVPRLRPEPRLGRPLPRPCRPLVPDAAAAPAAAVHDAPARARDAARPRPRGPRALTRPARRHRAQLEERPALGRRSP